MTIPVYVISFNQPTYLRNTIAQLIARHVSPETIHIVDNDSTLPELVDLLKLIEQVHPVHRMLKNFGHRVVFDARADIRLPEVYAVTDADLQFNAALPLTFLDDFARLAVRWGTWKCGMALDLDDGAQFLPGVFESGLSIRDGERKYWSDMVCVSPPVYRAPVDTTFACYVQSNYNGDFYNGIRVAGPYAAKHLPWYAESYMASGKQNLVRPSKDELEHYLSHENGASSIARLIRPYLTKLAT